MCKRDSFRPAVPLAGAAGGEGIVDPGTTTHDPSALAAWSEFHRAVGELRDEHRTVFELHYYQGLTQAEGARILGGSRCL